MRRAVPMAMLMLMSGLASADWVRIGESDTYVVYADPATIRRSGDIVRMSTMLDYRKPPDGGAYRSAESDYEYDCKGKRGRLLSMTIYSGQMGSGEVVVSAAPQTDWLPPARASADGWKFACGGK